MSGPRIHSMIWLQFPIDLGLTALSLLAAFWLASLGIPFELTKGTPDLDWYLGGALPVYLGSFVFAGVFFRLYRPRRAGSYGRLLFDLLKVNGQATLVVLALSFYLREYSFSRIILTSFFVMNPLVLFAHHMLWMARERRLHRRGIGTRRCLVVGRGELAEALEKRIETNPWAGLSVVGFLEHPEQQSTVRPVPESRVLGSLEELESVIQNHGIQEVLVAVPFLEMGTLAQIDRRLSESTVGLRWVPDLDALNTVHRIVSDFEGLALIDLRGAPVYGLSAFLKRTLDVVLSIVLLIVLSPVILGIALFNLLTSGRPIFFMQDRVGLDGRVFPLLKFRTMVKNAEQESGPVFATEGDSRVTIFGAFLRRTSLDEVPQLFNVLVGQMSLVGPRPERPVFIHEFKKTIPRYMLRHRMKAGLTGWAQVNGWRGNTSLKKRIQFDLYYIRNWSFWLDIKILLLTLVRAWGKRWNAY